MKKILNRIFIALSSINFTIILLALLVLTTLIASIADEIIPLFRSIIPSRATAIRSMLHFFFPADLHESPWFKTLLIMFSLNMLTCMIRRIPGTFRAFSLSHAEEAAMKPPYLTFEKTFTVPNLCRTFEHRLCGLLSRKLSIPTVRSTGTTSVFFSQGGKLFHGGFYLAHGGLFIILTGSVLGSSSAAGDIYLREGETTDRLFIREDGTSCFKRLNCTIRLDRCEPLPSPAGVNHPRRIGYRTTVTMLREDTRDITGVLEGYRTLTGHGMRIGQAGYAGEDRYAIMLEVTPRKAGGKRRTFSLRNHQFCTIPETGHTIRLRNIFLPEHPSPSLKETLSSSPPGTASLEIYGEYGSLIYTAPVSSPGTSTGHPWDEEYDLLIGGIEVTGASSPCMRLEASLEPGAGLIWAGTAIAIAGFGLIFLLSHRKLWVIIERSSGNARITIAGWASRNPDRLTGYADRIRELALQNTLRAG